MLSTGRFYDGISRDTLDEQTPPVYSTDHR